MRRLRIESLKFVVGLLLLGGCHTASAPSEPAPAETRAAAPERPAERFGARIRGQEPGLPVRELLAKPEAFEGKSVLVNGYVRRACARRGCWMELAEGSDEKNPGCRVTFKDYGFFVPTNSAGATARVEAKVVLASVSPSSVHHMESEGASFAEKTADGSAREVRLVASAVELFR